MTAKEAKEKSDLITKQDKEELEKANAKQTKWIEQDLVNIKIDTFNSVLLPRAFVEKKRSCKIEIQYHKITAELVKQYLINQGFIVSPIEEIFCDWHDNLYDEESHWVYVMEVSW